ncbi:MAG: 2-oxoacid:acceptor oxidoreductase family protein [Thermodesulfobacteriota bacterium]|nr:2-oxoacid:acceptor oxidoreductase family protein [Thermodesulfobacteriota bacterium]
MQTKGIVFSGSGGQGVITASIIMAEAAVIREGLNAVQTQVYGPEARGGATRADIIISDQLIHYPKVINPHVLVCLTQEAYGKFSGIVRPGGLLLMDPHFVRSAHKVNARQVELNMYKGVMERIGKPIVFNICMLGALISMTGLLKAESIISVLKTKIAPEFIELNRAALELGLELGSNSE